MPRYKLILEYDGAPFVGWQRQEKGLSVQGLLEEAAAALCGQKITVIGAGRTDAGVHALGQAAHLDLPKTFEPRTIRKALNYHLRAIYAKYSELSPKDAGNPVTVLDVAETGEDFHARFSAIYRRYCYRILNRSAPPALHRGLLWHIPVALDSEAMAEGGAFLRGHHDFTSFRAVGCQAQSAEKTLDRLEIERQGDEIRIHVGARSFLHHQVRNIAGTLRLVGEGKWPPERVKEALEAHDRRAAGPTAPAHGLYLVEVRYD